MCWPMMWFGWLCCALGYIVLGCGALGCVDERIEDGLDAQGVQSPHHNTLSQTKLRLDETGQTQIVYIDPFDGDVLHLTVEAAPETCLALTSLVDGQGRQWIGQRSFGPSCRDCALRTSVIRGRGMVSLPAIGDFSAAEGVSLRMGLVHCQTLTPVSNTTESTTSTASLSWQTGHVPKTGRLRVRLVTSAYSMFDAHPELQADLQMHINKRFEGTGLSLVWAPSQALEEAPETIEFSRADHQVLLSHHADVVAQEKTVDIVFMGCLYYRDLFFGARTAVQGYTTRVGASDGDAIYMPGRLCGSFGADPTPWPLDSYAHIVAHELGHFLGLYHVVEGDGVEDRLADTNVENLMHHNPSLTTSVGLTPQQSVIMRAHPWVE